MSFVTLPLPEQSAGDLLSGSKPVGIPRGLLKTTEVNFKTLSDQNRNPFMPTKSSGSSVRGTRKSTRRRRKVEEEPEAPAAEEVVEEAPAPAPAERSSDDNDDYDRAEGGDDNTEQQE